jgi:hypothetical protein
VVFKEGVGKKLNIINSGEVADTIFRPQKK